MGVMCCRLNDWDSTGGHHRDLGFYTWGTYPWCRPQNIASLWCKPPEFGGQFRLPELSHMLGKV